MLESIFVYPPIIQGAIGSFVFWLLFELFKRLGKRGSDIFGHFNKSWREETLEFAQLQSQYMLAPPTERANFILIALYGAANRVVTGLVYIGMGLVANSFIHPIGTASYFIAILYFFRAFRAIPFTVSDGHSLEWHRNQVKKLQKELDKLRATS